MHLSLKISFIKFWKVARELHNLENMVMGSNTPSLVINTTFYSSSSFIWIFGWSYWISNLEKIMASLILSINIWGLGIGYLFLTVNLLSSLQSCTRCKLPLFFLTKKKDKAWSDFDSLIQPLFKFSLTNSFIAWYLHGSRLKTFLCNGLKSGIRSITWLYG